MGIRLLFIGDLIRRESAPSECGKKLEPTDIGCYRMSASFTIARRAN